MGLGRGFGEEEVADHQEVQAPQTRYDVGCVGRGERRVRAVDHEHAGAVPGAQRVQQFGGRDAGPGDALRVHAPRPGHVFPVCGVGDLAVAGQLVALLPVLAPALAVALSRDGAESSGGGTRQPQKQCQVDCCRGGVGAVDVLFHAASGQDEDGPAAGFCRMGRQSQGACGAPDLAGGNARDGFDPFGPPLCQRAAQCAQSIDSPGQVFVVDERLREEHLGQAQEQLQVTGRCRLQVPAGTVGAEIRRCRAAGIHHHQPAGGAGPLEVPHERGHGVGDVGSQHQDHGGPVQVGQREGQAAVESERAVTGRCGR